MVFCPFVVVESLAKPEAITIRKGEQLANHLTPEELSQRYGVKLEEVLQIIHEEGIPRYAEGKVCRGLFEPHLKKRLLAAA